VPIPETDSSEDTRGHQLHAAERQHLWDGWPIEDRESRCCRMCRNAMEIRATPAIPLAEQMNSRRFSRSGIARCYSRAPGQTVTHVTYQKDLSVCRSANPFLTKPSLSLAFLVRGSFPHLLGSSGGAGSGLRPSARMLLRADARGAADHEGTPVRPVSSGECGVSRTGPKTKIVYAVYCLGLPVAKRDQRQYRADKLVERGRGALQSETCPRTLGSALAKSGCAAFNKRALHTAGRLVIH
jgi:hypothetical protein